MGRPRRKARNGSPIANSRSPRGAERRKGLREKKREMSVDHIDFYHEKKFCKKCGKYVRFLMSIHHSYCIDCGSIVYLFSQKDKRKFFKEPVDAKKAKAFHL